MRKFGDQFFLTYYQKSSKTRKTPLRWWNHRRAGLTYYQYSTKTRKTPLRWWKHRGAGSIPFSNLILFNSST